MKTYFETAENAIKNRKWVVIDAQDKVVGRLASHIADILRGKNKPQFTPHVDTGDFVVVVNADKIVFTGRKLEQKKYYRHTGFVGGVVEEKASEWMATKPEKIITKAVQRMLPKTALGRNLLSKLKVYTGDVHPHTAQQPTVVNL